MTCKECICYEKCKSSKLDFAESADPNHICQYFKNKADFVEVSCKCSDCKEWKRNVGVVNSPNGHCFYHGIQMNAYDFCSYGERKQ